MDGYDYSRACNYFVTIVIQDRLDLLGEIKDGQMIPNDAGLTIEKALLNIPDTHRDVELPFLVVMPNHIHFILTILGAVYLGEIIRRFKSLTTHLYIEGVKNQGWQPFNKKLWQHNYFEHIIRNQRSYEFIANYIITNPQRWAKDAINPSCDNDRDEIMKQVLMID
jgi:REP element-mobilizing transposase RayT